MSPTIAAWTLFTRLGEAQILLPAMAVALLWLLRTPATRPLAGAWLLSTAVAAAITTLTKVAFIGWFVGYAPLDYTGISGHAMFAAAVLPVLVRVVAGRRASAPWTLLAGLLLAAAIAWSRIVTHAHSPFEAALGFVLGSAASLWALHRAATPKAPPPAWLAIALLAWLVVLPIGAPPSRTHDWVTRLSLGVSGHQVPYTRRDLHRRASGPSGHLGTAPARQVHRQPVAQRQFGAERLA